MKIKSDFYSPTTRAYYSKTVIAKNIDEGIDMAKKYIRKIKGNIRLINTTYAVVK